MRRWVCPGLAVLAATCAAAVDAHADGRGVVVVNAAATADARAAAAKRTAEVRRNLVARGVARELPETLRAAVEGRPARGFRLELEAVRRAYGAFEYRRAQQLLETATADALATADPDALPEVLAQILFWRGVVAVAQGERTAARRWFAGSLRLCPSRVVDRKRFPPRVRRSYAAARAALAGLADGELEIEVVPAKARIALDDRAPVDAPETVRAGSGIHLIVASHGGGFERHARLVELAAGARKKIAISLRPEGREAAARRAIAAAAAVRAPASRVRRWSETAAVLGASQLLAVEQRSDGALQARLYDVVGGGVSSPVPLGDAGVPDAVAELAATRLVDLSPPATSADGDSEVLARFRPPVRDRRGTRWYRRWWVWAAVGAVAASTATAVYFERRDREPTLHGFGGLELR